MNKPYEFEINDCIDECKKTIKVYPLSIEDIKKFNKINKNINECTKGCENIIKGELMNNLEKRIDAMRIEFTREILRLDDEIKCIKNSNTFKVQEASNITADEMFKELGYKIEYENDDEIIYVKNYDQQFDECKIRIIFDCGVAGVLTQPNGKKEPYYFSKKELTAICKKYQELEDEGWL